MVIGRYRIRHNLKLIEHIRGKSIDDSVTFEDFMKLDIRVGTIVEAIVFEKAKRPAYQLKIDLGEELGVKKSSAQITEVYKEMALKENNTIVEDAKKNAERIIKEQLETMKFVLYLLL